MSDPSEPDPQSTSEAVNAVAAAAAADDFGRASTIADAALAKGYIHPALFNARALWLQRQGRDSEALDEFQRARALATRDVTLLNAIGLCMTRLGRLKEAIDVFDESLRTSPAHAPTHQRKGAALAMSGENRQAGQSWQRAVQLQPGNAEALAGLASIAAADGNGEGARACSERALRSDPRNATAHATLALLDVERSEFVAAEQRLRPLLDRADVAGHGRAVALGLLGDALDGQDRTSEAFEAQRAANAELHALHAPRFGAGRSPCEVVEALAGWLATAAPETLSFAADSGEPPEQPARQQVFLLGFHRSGTTLLEQVLRSNSDVTSLEERDALGDLAERYLTSADGFERMASLAGPSLAVARAEYWRNVRGFGVEPNGKVFVDKHPLNTIKLPLIARLFPKAKILFAMRDPRDVVLSCFRRHFEINAAMFQYLTLEGTARFYDAVMRVGDLARTTSSLEILEHRYETMILDFEGQTKAVCAFIGVPWDAAMKNFAATARGQDIRSPSARQVRRGLYAGSVGQWRRYRAELEPVLPILQPWAERFGYPPD